jgi:hypothetical protein
MKTWLHAHQRLLRHVLFWVVASVSLFLIQLPSPLFMGARLYWRSYVLAELPTLLLGTYPLLYGLLPLLLVRRQPWLFLGALLGWVVAAALVSNLFWVGYTWVVTPVFFGEKPPQAFHWADVFGDLNFGFFALLLVAGAASAVKVFNEWYRQQQLSQVLRQRQLHAELQLLKAQLQPDFLFSSLRTLHALTLHKSPDSPAAVLHLSALLRYMLYDSQLDAVPLADEVDMMRHYVALEQLRPGSQLEVSLNFSGALDHHRIAPLLLLPFVENAFWRTTHAPHECPWLSLDLVAKAHSLTFKVINSQPTTADPASEPAFASVRKRLARLYPGRHQLKVRPEPDSLLMALHLQLGPATPTAQPVPARPQPQVITQP